MRQSESISKLAAALVVAQGELSTVGKDRANTFFNSKYATLDAIVEHVRPVLAKHRLAVIQGATMPETDANGVLRSFVVETMLVHESGEWLVNASIMPVAPQTKRDGTVLPIGPQAAGSAITYGRRYGISALLSLATDEDDDGNHANGNDRHYGKPEGEQRRPPQRQNSQSSTTRQATASTPAAAASATSASGATASGPVWPFGKQKGKPLAESSDRAILSGITWCTENGKTDWAQLLTNEQNRRNQFPLDDRRAETTPTTDALRGGH